MSDPRPINPLPAFGETAIAGFDVAAGTATLISQNDGWPSYDIVARSVFYPSGKVTHQNVTPQRFWDVYTIGQDTGPAIGLYMPGYGFDTDDGWVWFVLNESIDFKDCAAGAAGSGRTQFNLAELLAVARDARAAQAPAPPPDESQLPRVGMVERVLRAFRSDR